MSFIASIPSNCAQFPKQLIHVCLARKLTKNISSYFVGLFAKQNFLKCWISDCWNVKFFSFALTSKTFYNILRNWLCESLHSCSKLDNQFSCQKLLGIEQMRDCIGVGWALILKSNILYYWNETVPGHLTFTKHLQLT